MLLRLRAAEDRLHSGDELARREGLRQVVVGADLETDDTVRLLVTRREHEDRHLRLRANLATDVEAVLPRQADVEQDHPYRVTIELRQRILTRPDPDHAVAVAREVRA